MTNPKYRVIELFDGKYQAQKRGNRSNDGTYNYFDIGKDQPTQNKAVQYVGWYDANPIVVWTSEDD